MRNSKALNTLKRGKNFMTQDILIRKTPLEEIIEQANNVPIQIIGDSKGYRIEQDGRVDTTPRVNPYDLFRELISRYHLDTNRKEYSSSVFKEIFSTNTFYVQLDYTRGNDSEQIDLYSSHNP